MAPKITQSGNQWILRITPSDMVMASNYVDFAVNKLGLKKLAILHDSSDYGKGALPTLIGKMKKLGLEPVKVESFNVGDKDFAGQLNNIKNSGADGVFLWGLYVEGAQILIQAKQLGLDIPFFASSGVLQGPSWIWRARRPRAFTSPPTSPWITRTPRSRISSRNTKSNTASPPPPRLWPSTGPMC